MRKHELPFKVLGDQAKQIEALKDKLRQAVNAMEYCISDVKHPRYSFPGAKLDAPVNHWSHTGPQDGIHRCPRCMLDAALASVRDLLEDDWDLVVLR